MLTHFSSLNIFCGERGQSILFQIIMIDIVSGRKFSKTSAWISTTIQPLMNSFCSISLMALQSSINLIWIVLFQVVSAILILWLNTLAVFSFLFSFDWSHSFFTLAVVPEGSFIVRAHTPMSNLFSCLWFNEVDRFTSRDQLSFAYTFLKLKRMNPGKPFFLNMFKVSNNPPDKDCSHTSKFQNQNTYWNIITSITYNLHTKTSICSLLHVHH